MTQRKRYKVIADLAEPKEFDGVLRENDEMLVDVCSVYGGNENNVELQEANAHLIAAAPEMLWALEQVAALGREASNSDGQVYLDESNFLYILEIAIAKAKGKTSGE